MLQVGLGLFERGDGERLCRSTVTETCDLRKDEPHPVTGLVSRLVVHQGPCHRRDLARQESVEDCSHRSYTIRRVVYSFQDDIIPGNV